MNFGNRRAQAIGSITETVKSAAGKVTAIAVVALVVAVAALVVALVKG